MLLWLLMTACVMLLPVLMLALGAYYRNHAPKTIGGWVGYRTPMSCKNEDTWVFAHHTFGALWVRWGWGCFLFSAVAMVLLGWQLDALGEDALALLSCAVLLLQMLFLFLPIFKTERALREVFAPDGTRRNP